MTMVLPLTLWTWPCTSKFDLDGSVDVEDDDWLDAADDVAEDDEVADEVVVADEVADDDDDAGADDVEVATEEDDTVVGCATGLG